MFEYVPQGEKRIFIYLITIYLFVCLLMCSKSPESKWLRLNVVGFYVQYLKTISRNLLSSTLPFCFSASSVICLRLLLNPDMTMTY